jgi:hypothetical protein
VRSLKVAEAAAAAAVQEVVLQVVVALAQEPLEVRASVLAVPAMRLVAPPETMAFQAKTASRFIELWKFCNTGQRSCTRKQQ